MKTNGWLLRLAAMACLACLAAVPPAQDATPASTPSSAAPPVWVSPTPDETGAIVVIVQPGESLWVIAARAGLSLPELLALNDLSGSTVISPGDAIVIGHVTPLPPTPEPTIVIATLTPPTPRPTDPLPVAAVCLSAFDDVDRDGIQDPGEPLRAGVAFTVYNTQSVVANYITDGFSEPKCLGGLVPGEYRVTRSIAPGEILTTAGDWSLNLTEGEDLNQAFGSVLGEGILAGATEVARQPAVVVVTATPGPEAPDTEAAPRSGLAGRLLGVAALFFGGLILLGAVLILLFRSSSSREGSKPGTNAEDGNRRFRNLDDLE